MGFWLVEESPVVKEKFSPIGQRSTAVLIKYPWSADPKSTKSLINRFGWVGTAGAGKSY